MKEAFNNLTYRNKKFWIEFTEEPKTEEAKVHRVNRLFEFLMGNGKM